MTDLSIVQDPEEQQPDGVPEHSGSASDSAALYPGDAGLLPEPPRHRDVAPFSGAISD